MPNSAIPMNQLEAALSKWDAEIEVADETVSLYLTIRKLSIAYADGLDKELAALSPTKLGDEGNSPLGRLKEYAKAVAKTHRSFAENVLVEVVKPFQATVTFQTAKTEDIVTRGRQHSKRINSHPRHPCKTTKRLSWDSRITMPRSQPTSGQYFSRSLDSNYLHKYIEDNSDEIKRILDALHVAKQDRLVASQKTLVKFAGLADIQVTALKELGDNVLENYAERKAISLNVEKSQSSTFEDTLREPLIKLKADLAASVAVAKDLPQIMQSSWEGKTLTSSDMATLRVALASQQGRTDCMHWINQYRAKGAYELQGLESVGQVLNVLLDAAHSQLDVVNASLAIVLSQTFHNSAHQFLQSKITTHVIWSDSAFWDSAFLYKVNEDLTQFTQLCSLEFGSESELEAKFHSVIFSQVPTFIAIMRSFDLTEADIIAFIHRQCKRFDLTPSEQEVLMMVISNVD